MIAIGCASRSAVRALVLPRLTSAAPAPGTRATLPPARRRPGRRRVREADGLRPVPAAAIGLDPLERGARDPGHAGVAARVARHARRDRRADDGQLDHTVRGGEPERRRRPRRPSASAKLRSRTIPPRAQRRALGPHRRVDARRGRRSPVELQRLGLARRRRRGRDRARDGVAAFGDAGERARSRARRLQRARSRSRARRWPRRTCAATDRARSPPTSRASTMVAAAARARAGS